MIFKKNEQIELSGGVKHIVADIKEYDGTIYYCVCEIDSNGKQVKDNISIITTIKENNQLFIKTIKGKLEEELFALFDIKK